MTPPPLDEDTRPRRLLRRALTVPLTLLAAPLSLALSPLTVALAALVDLARGQPWPRARLALFLPIFLGCEALGILGAALLALPRMLGLTSDERWLRQNFALQRRWVQALARSGFAIFGVELEVEGLDEVPPGPLIALCRHASAADTLLPVLLLGCERGIMLRYVLKRELLWDPCLDIVGRRLPNAFVARGSQDPEREAARVARLAEDLHAGQGVLIYPEGTRFSASKRARVLEKLAAAGDAERLATAQALSHTLPPRAGGPLALLEACPAADLVVIAHAGLDSLLKPAAWRAGSASPRRVAVRIWRVAADNVPRSREARLRWLDAQWREVDAFVAAQGG